MSDISDIFSQDNMHYCFVAFMSACMACMKIMVADPQICFKDSAKLQLLETPLLHIKLTSKLGQEPQSIKKFMTVFLKIFESFCLFSGQNLLLLGHMMTHFRGNKKSGYTFKFLENGPFFMRKRNHFNKTCDLFRK